MRAAWRGSAITSVNMYILMVFSADFLFLETILNRSEKLVGLGFGVYF